MRNVSRREFLAGIAGVGAAGALGTVTILDSQTYTEDLTIQAPANAYVTIQAATGQSPTIEAANAVAAVLAVLSFVLFFIFLRATRPRPARGR